MLEGNMSKTDRMVWTSGRCVQSFGTEGESESQRQAGAAILLPGRPRPHLNQLQLGTTHVHVSMCVCVCDWECELFACTSGEAQWAGADALSSHTNSPNRECYLCLSAAFRLPCLCFSVCLSLGLSTSDTVIFIHSRSQDACSTACMLIMGPPIVLLFLKHWLHAFLTVWAAVSDGLL